MKKLFTILMLLFGVIGTASAQITTSALSGNVVDSAGEAIVGATVQVIHQPSGTRYGAVTNPSGVYSIQGMRVGGPYRVEISYVGAQSAVIDGVVLKLGETADVSAQLTEQAQAIQDVVVSARRGIDAGKTGAASSVNSAQISRIPSLTGSIGDAIRLTPQVRVSRDGNMQFAGTSNRYNSFQIDGASNNDIFGLSGNGANGGQAGTQPVAMETIEQIQVNIAPYDVRQSGFTGGSINAITKSGTNRFSGSVYGFGNNQALIGRKHTTINGKEIGKLDNRHDYRVGVTLGGPIVKDKLFFFANYERTDVSTENINGLGSKSSQVDADNAKKILNKIQEMAKSQGVEYKGGFFGQDYFARSDKAGMKLDWNISDRHKASVRYSFVGATQLNNVSGASSLNTSDNTFEFVNRTHTLTAELHSRFSDVLSNEFRVSAERVRDHRDPNGDAFPKITIRNVGKGTVNIGNDQYSTANSLDQDALTITDNFTAYLGDHTLTVGTHNEFYKFANKFIASSYGDYVFNNVNDFNNGVIGTFNLKRVNTSVTGDPNWKATFATGQLGFYIQDKYRASDKLEMTIGTRVDIPLFFDTPTENREFNKFAESKGLDYRTDKKIASTPLVSPRFGFRYKIDDKAHYVVRGGVGIFTGRIPFVWLSNSFSNTGIQIESYYAKDKAASGLSLILDPNRQMENANKLTKSPTAEINVFSGDFQFVQNLRSNLGVDFELGGIEWTAEAIWSKTLNDIKYQDLSREKSGKTLGEVLPGVEFDSRPMFTKVDGTKPFTNIYALSNTSKGYTYNLSLSGKKSFDFGLDLSASYTYTRSMSINGGTSSQASSNFKYNYTRGDANDSELGFSAYNFPHAVNVSAFYNKNYGAWTTTVGLIYNGNSGSPYSVFYNGDVNNDGSPGNDLMFIPTDAQIDKMPFADYYENEVLKYSADTQRKNMKAWISRDEYLRAHRGEYFERFAANEKFEHHFDLHLAQKFTFNRNGKTRHSIELSFDMLNVGNLFNSEWGRYGGSSGFTYFSPVTYDSKSSTFQFLNGANYNMHSYNDLYSRWRGQVGVKYTF